MMPPLVEVRDLRYRYEDGTPALNGVDFCLGAGESVALLGANGSGKTTFLMHLNGLLSGQGSVAVCGLAVEKRNLARIRGKIGMVFQDADSQLFMPTVIEDVAFGLLNLDLPAEEAFRRARAALDQVGLAASANRAPYQLSAGEKRKAALAGILAMDPEILALDEPTTSLDPPAQRALAILLARLPQAKIVVTHNIRFARAVCTRAVFFQAGRIVAAGTVEEIACRFEWDSIAESSRP